MYDSLTLLDWSVLHLHTFLMHIAGPYGVLYFGEGKAEIFLCGNFTPGSSTEMNNVNFPLLWVHRWFVTPMSSTDGAVQYHQLAVC